MSSWPFHPDEDNAMVLFYCRIDMALLEGMGRRLGFAGEKIVMPLWSAVFGS